jgi:multiple sugar transport system ATP-binding protein
MSKIEFRHVNKRYNAQSPLTINNANLVIEDGEFCVFVGPSGCGKSTLLRMVAGFEDISAGDLLIGGERVNDLAPARRGVALVFQSYALYPHMTVRENMAFGLKVLGSNAAEIDKKVRAAAEILQLTPLLDRLPKALSGGQRQRVAIGRAIVKEPRVFLFDEPLSNLDAALRVQTRLEIAKLHNDIGTASMIYVTHDQVEAMTLADKIVLLRSGPDVQSRSEEHTSELQSLAV